MISVSEWEGTARTSFGTCSELSCPSYVRNHGNASARGQGCSLFVCSGMLLWVWLDQISFTVNNQSLVIRDMGHQFLKGAMAGSNHVDQKLCFTAQ